MGTLGRDGGPGEGQGPQGGTGTLGRAGDTGEGQGLWGGMRTLAKDGDTGEACGAQGTDGDPRRGMEISWKRWGPRGGTWTPGNDGDPKEGSTIPVPMPHATGWLLPTPLGASPARPQAMPPHPGHSTELQGSSQRGVLPLQSPHHCGVWQREPFPVWGRHFRASATWGCSWDRARSRGWPHCTSSCCPASPVSPPSWTAWSRWRALRVSGHTVPTPNTEGWRHPCCALAASLGRGTRSVMCGCCQDGQG